MRLVPSRLPVRFLSFTAAVKGRWLIRLGGAITRTRSCHIGAMPSIRATIRMWMSLSSGHPFRPNVRPSRAGGRRCASLGDERDCEPDSFASLALELDDAPIVGKLLDDLNTSALRISLGRNHEFGPTVSEVVYFDTNFEIGPSDADSETCDGMDDGVRGELGNHQHCCVLNLSWQVGEVLADESSTGCYRRRIEAVALSRDQVRSCQTVRLLSARRQGSRSWACRSCSIGDLPRRVVQTPGIRFSGQPYPHASSTKRRWVPRARQCLSVASSNADRSLPKLRANNRETCI